MTLAAEGPDLLQQAVVYLGATVVAVPLAQRFGLGSVLGYLLAGIAVGPAGFNLVGNTEAVMHFAEFGVVMMLFVIGLELQPRVLWRMRGAVLGLGGLQVVVTVAAVAGIALALGQGFEEATAIGLVLALSSTAIVMQSLAERGLQNTEGGRSAFGILLFQDIAVIPILALLPLLAPPGGASDGGVAATGIEALPGWGQGLVILGTIALVIFGGHFLLRPVLRAVAGTRLRELFTATALLLVVGISVAMTAVGLSPALGTFLAGVVLADSEYRHELEVNLEPFKGLLLGLFFITVGAGIDFELIGREPLLIGLLVVGLILLKATVLFGLVTLWRLKMPQRWTVALGLAQAGEFAFVLLALTTSQSILPADTTRLLVVVVALTMAVTPLLFLLNERVIRPRFAVAGEERGSDDPSQHRMPVVIAGFGRYGQIVGRLLRANGFSTTVLDLDPRSIQVLREHGMTVFYGDAARPGLLEAAGCGEAKLFVLAVDSTEHARVIAQTVRHHYPDLPIVARVRDNRAAHALRALGVHETVCEATGSGLEMGDMVLQRLGHHPYRSLRATRRFRRHESETQKQLFEAWGDETRTLKVARARVADLDRLLVVDEEQPMDNVDKSWQAPAAAERARD